MDGAKREGDGRSHATCAHQLLHDRIGLRAGARRRVEPSLDRHTYFEAVGVLAAHVNLNLARLSFLARRQSYS